MSRSALLLLVFLSSFCSSAQYPYVRSFEVRAGQQRPRVRSMAQDAQGLLWLATDVGLLRTDGELCEKVMVAEGRTITALGARSGEVYSVWNDGTVVRCVGMRCDTLFRDSLLVRSPVRAVARDGQGDLWLATYGAGVMVVRKGVPKWITMAQGLNDDHVNDLCLVDEDKVAVATDQGIAICSWHGVLRRIREQDGLPDNLVLSLSPASGGRLWAGTDRGGVLTFDPRATRPRVRLLDSTWQHGPVNAIMAEGTIIWAATSRNGVVVCDVNQGLASYLPTNAAAEVGVQAVDLLRVTDGSVLWCDGSDRIHRADPNVLLVPKHEERDLRHITALCSDHLGRIWFATADGIYHHGAAFADELRLDRADLEVGMSTPVASLRADEQGGIWVGTVGDGVYRIAADGSILHYSESDGLANNNVLSVRMRGEEVWFATLAGLCVRRADGRFEHPAIPGSGFVYDVLPMADGSVLAATDGSGVLRLDPSGTTTRIRGTQAVESFYSFTLDDQGRAWACGPGTGLCQVMGDSLACHAADKPPFDGSVFGIVASGEQLVAMGSSGVALYKPAGDDLLDLGGSIGLTGIDAELNTIAVDDQGAIWLACDKGLVRIAASAPVLNDRVPCVITALEAGGESIPFDLPIDLRHDQNFVQFRFAGPFFAAPASVRFQYRLAGYDATIRETRDREVSFSRLPPGRYVLELRAFLAEDDPPEEWVSLPFLVRAPWYRTPAALVAIFAAALTLLFVLIRGRESRLRYRDRVEKEKARFQLDALRSQVNPHFLFNSFNTLIELIEEDKGKAVEHVEHLSEFFRNILMVRDKELIPLREELRLLDTYFYLEQRRFGERIALDIRIPEEMREHLLPPLTLQLLVENAIKHNAATSADPLRIEVVAVGEGLEVVNPVRLRRSALPSTGFGVDSIRKRYAALSVMPVEVTNDGAYFRVRIPLLPKP